MASYHGSTQSEPPKWEQIITDFFAKSLHIILESRSPYVSSHNFSGEQMISSPASSSSSSSSVRPRDKRFNLALRDCPAALENIDFWRQTPMVVDVILVRRSRDPASCAPGRGASGNLSSKERSPLFRSSDHAEFGCERSEKIIERWVVRYETRKGAKDCTSASKRSSSNSSHTLSKKLILLLRSLYATMRLLPAYKLFRKLISSGQIFTFNLAPRVSTFVEPFTHREESEMQQFLFTPIETFCGRLCLSVLYHSSVSDMSSEPSTPMSPQFIPHYIGSPMADPLKRFPSLPVPQGSPCSSPFARRHSWSYDLYNASPPSALPSPSPTYSDSRALISKSSSHCLPPTNLPRYLPETPQPLKNNTIFDEYSPSPVFSPSPSPSPPAYFSGTHTYKSILRSESAPLSIPSSRLASTPSNNRQILPPSPPPKCTRPGASKMDRSSGLAQSSSTIDKLCPFGKTESGRYSAVKTSSNSSPQKSFSRSSSRMSFQDDFDDTEFCGPFVVDDDDLTEPGSRLGSFDHKGNLCGPLEPGGLFQGRKNQDAAVGALVQMLKKAPPLHQDLSHSLNLSEPLKPVNLSIHNQEPNQTCGLPGAQETVSLSLTSSRHVFARTKADGLEELRGYTEMKDLLLKSRLLGIAYWTRD